MYKGFGNVEMSEQDIHGYLILGLLHGKYFNMYGDNDQHILFDKEDFSGPVTALDCPFIIFKNMDDAIEDASNLKKCCYSDAYELKMKIAECTIVAETQHKKGEFINYDAYEVSNIIINKIVH